MKPVQASLSISLLFLQPCHVAAADFNHDRFCKLAKEAQAKGDRDIGTMVDKYTRNDGMTLLCGHKAVDFKKFVIASHSDMREGWQDRIAAQWNNIYCAIPIWRDAIENGWSVSFTVTTQDGKRFSQQASCPATPR